MRGMSRAISGRWARGRYGAAAMVLATGTFAQPPGARPVEQGVGDVGPLSESTRVLPRDLRKPRGFDRVYEISRTTPLGTTEQTLIRIDGAVTAIFPRSVYTVGSAGWIAETPPGTIFHIGRLPPEFDLPDVERPLSPLAINLAADFSARQVPVSGNRPPSPGSRRAPASDVQLADPPSIWTHEDFRQHRLAQMLRAARATGAGRTP